jgi:hypothetical protein
MLAHGEVKHFHQGHDVDVSRGSDDESTDAGGLRSSTWQTDTTGPLRPLEPFGTGRENNLMEMEEWNGSLRSSHGRALGRSGSRRVVRATTTSCRCSPSQFQGLMPTGEWTQRASTSRARG